MNGKKILVAYFSASGQTRKLAKTLAQTVGGDLFEIEPQIPYTSADLNWNDGSSRSSKEMKDPSSRPAIAGKVSHMDAYDVVFVGFPIWWGVAPHIVDGFLESYDLTGKTIVPFATSGGSGMGGTDDILKRCCKGDPDWRRGKLLPGSATATAISKWVDGLKL